MGRVVRQPQLLKIIPGTELEFRGDPKDINTSHIQLINDTSHKIGFKVMTNVPHLLFVSPASDAVRPGSQSSIKVMLQPNQDSSETGGMRFHKLLIQSIIVQPEDEGESIDKLISRKNNSGEVMETKLNCSFKEIYTSELDFPLGSEHAGPDVPNSALKGESEEFPSKPNLSTILSTAIVAILVVIVLWYVYTSYTSETRDETPVAANDPKSEDADDG